MSKTVTYFIARGRSLEIIEAYLTGIEDHLTHTNEMAKRLGADGTYRREGRQCVGFAFTKEKDIPKGLRRNKTDFEMCVPDRRIKEGQALENEMNSKPCPTHWKITGDLMGAPKNLGLHPSGRGMSLGLISFEKVGDDFLIGLPHREGDEVKTTPPDAVQIKTSEYWAMKEAAA